MVVTFGDIGYYVSLRCSHFMQGVWAGSFTIWDRSKKKKRFSTVQNFDRPCNIISNVMNISNTFTKKDPVKENKNIHRDTNSKSGKPKIMFHLKRLCRADKKVC